MRKLVQIMFTGCVLLLVAQFIRPGIPASPSTAELQAPPDVQRVLRKDCYSCHSNERRLSWFDQIVPAYWLVRSDLLTARQHLDFSTLGAKPAAAQRAALYESVNMIQLGQMPLPKFTRLHPEARVSSEELATLKAYLAPWSQPLNLIDQSPKANEHEVISGASRLALAQKTVSPELNGLAFDATFEDWKPVSITDRGDNNTFRFILGNNIAIRAIRSGNLSPWPDGASLAKIAWQQERHADGFIYPGAFVQVELMIKDAHLYKRTDGWGWGRWRSLDLKPYGSNASFVGECTTCHLPVRGDDAVYTLPITVTKMHREEVVNTNAAALPAGLPDNPLDWGAITLFTNRQDHTIALLYGNDLAMNSVRSRTSNSVAPQYAAGSKLALVTWAERDDPHWFGARIPDVPRSIEFIQIAGTEQHRTYRRFAGAGLAEQKSASSDSTRRIADITALLPAMLP